MKLSISNIAWSVENDNYFYSLLKELGYKGLEIAPTRIISEKPYDNLDKAKDFAYSLKMNYDLEISSMQSIWYGKTEEIFSSSVERNILLEYTKKAIDFANEISCKNLVFGSPKNRNIKEETHKRVAEEFFNEIGNYAVQKDTVFALEANPIIYNTNFINYTSQAVEIVKKLNNPGVLVNYDMSTVIYNEETIEEETFNYVNHIHISEPYMELIQNRDVHSELFGILKKINYQKYVSIEMKTREDIKEVEKTLKYVKELYDRC